MNFVYQHELPASVYSAKNILEMNGIECLLKNEHGNSMGPEFGTSNLLELWVKKPEDLALAKSLIDSEVVNPEVKSAWICASCEESNEGNFDVCWQCQSSRLAS